MTALSYRPALSLVLAHEGGFVDHAKDPGGPTNFGVTQTVYDAYRKSLGAPVRSVKLITADEVEDIYKKQYWRLVRGDSLPAGLDYAVLDFAVNSGVSRAIRYLQRLVGVNDDGTLGLVTMSAIYDAAKADEEKLILLYCANRMAFLKSLGTFPTFGKGWTRRVMGSIEGAQDNDKGVIDLAILMARKDIEFVLPAPIGAYAGEVPGKATSESDLFPMATPGDLASLATQNNALADLIAMDKLK